MKVRMNKAIGILIIILAGMDLCLFLVLALGAHKTEYSFAFSSLVALGIGILFLRGVYFEVSQNRLILKSLLGTAQTNYPVDSPQEISLVGRQLFITHGGVRQKLPIYSWMADRRDWDALALWLRSENGTL
jgi:hypothetical protein